MGKNWITCPNRKGGGKVSIEVCLKNCKVSKDCKELQAIQKEVIPIQPLTEDKVPKEALPVSEQGVKNGKDGTDDTDTHYAVASHTPEKFIKSRAMVLFDRAIEIRQEIGTKFLEMGEILHLMFQERCYKEFGYEDEESFCEAVLNIKGRTAAYLRSIYCWQTKLDIPSLKIAEIGWAKAKEIIPVSKTKEDALEWIEKVKKAGMTVQTIYEEAQIAQGKKTREEVKIRPIKVILALFPDQKEIWDRAVDVGKKVTGSESVGYVVTGAICPEFLSTYPDGYMWGSKTDVIVMALNSFEMAWGVKINGDVVNRETGEILVERK